jgi:hypothetical protein
MPNGHGGVPYFGGPILFSILFAIITSLPVGNDGWLAWPRVGICLLLAAAIGWRLAYYFHMYDADDYGGAQQMCIGKQVGGIGSRHRFMQPSQQSWASLCCGGVVFSRPRPTQ